MAITRGNPRNVSIHHSAVSPPVTNLSGLKSRANAHNNFHKANSQRWRNTTPGEYGYRYIRYHYMIAQNGDVLQTQDEKYALYANGDGTGINSFNKTAVNIMFEGNYQTAKPTEQMMLAAVKLIRSIEKKYNINPRVRGHKELSSTGTACPGNNLGDSKSGWIKQLIANVNNPNYPGKWTDEVVKLPEPTTYIANKDTHLFEIDTGNQMANFKRGQEITVAYSYRDWLITEFSFSKEIKNGFRMQDWDIKKSDNCDEVINTLQEKINGLELITEAQRGELERLNKEIEDLSKVKELTVRLATTLREIDKVA